jgi:hypothetical protein
MIDWLYSKITVTIVVFMLIAFFVGFFEWHDNQVAITELQNITDEIAGRVNELSNIEAETALNFTFNKYLEGVKLPPQIQNQQYIIKFTGDVIFATWEGAQVASTLTYPVNNISNVNTIHVWEPSAFAYKRADIATADDAALWYELESGYDFVVERKLIEVSGHLEYHTFVYQTVFE